MANDAGIQLLIGAALTDPAVRDALLHHPLDLAEKFELSVLERRFLATARPRDLEHFAALVEEWRGGLPPASRSETRSATLAQLAG